MNNYQQQQNFMPFQPKSTPITDDYEISNNVLGLGINGKVVECIRKANGSKYALKVSAHTVDNTMNHNEGVQLSAQSCGSICINVSDDEILNHHPS